MRIARIGGAAAEHHRDEVTIVALDRGDDIEAGIMDVAGLDAVDAGNAAEQMIVVAHLLAAELESPRGEVAVILWKAVVDGSPDDGLVARGGDLLVVGQAGGVVIGGVRHAERARLGGHQPGEIGFISGKGFGHDDRHVVGRLGDDGADGGLDPDRLARLEPQLGRRLRGGMGRHRHFGRHLDLARLQPLEQQIERHDLGQRGRMARTVGVGRLHHRAGIGVHHDR